MDRQSDCEACLLHKADSLFTVIGQLRRVNSKVNHTCGGDDLDVLLREINDTVFDEESTEVMKMRALNIPFSCKEMGPSWCSIDIKALFSKGNTIYSAWRSIVRIFHDRNGYLKVGNYHMKDDGSIMIVFKVELTAKINLEDLKTNLEKQTDSKITILMDTLCLYTDH